ncbi:MAG: nucleotidyltransferase family protein [Gammaproteobacteria bacterium]
MYSDYFQTIVSALLPACQAVYGARLKSLALFGSVARGTMRPDSDIDVLLIAAPLPAARSSRLDEFEQVEQDLAPFFKRARGAGVDTDLSAVIKTPEELRQGSLLFLDMVEQARLLHDPERLLRGYLDGLAARLQAMGARRITQGGGYYWVLTPDFKPGDRIAL